MVGGGALAEETGERLRTGHPRDLGRVQAERVRRCHVAAHDAHAVVMDDNAVGYGVEGLLPDALRGPERVEQARVVQRERGHLAEPF